MQKKLRNYPHFVHLIPKMLTSRQQHSSIACSTSCFKSLMLMGMVLLMLQACAHQGDQRIDLKNLDIASEYVEIKTPLMTAAERGDSQALKAALLKGGKINAHTTQETAFSLALKNGHEAISRILLSAGADWQKGYENNPTTALIIAADQGYDEIVKMLILKGAPLESTDEQGYTALAKAARKGHLTTLKILINAGAKVNVQPEGRSVLMHVVEKNNMLLSQLLIAAGADLNFTDAEGDTALKIARRNGFYDLDLMLVQAGARP